MAAVRYIVNDVDEAVGFYRELLGFTVEKHNPSKFAALSRDDLRLFINVPGAGSAGKAGGDPKPGGWNRFQIETEDLDDMVARLRITPCLSRTAGTGHVDEQSQVVT